jgi:3-oxosteroid 1-dehydrogenase
MMDRRLPVWLESPMQELTTDGQGRVTGAVVRHEGRDVRITARRGVVLAAGGFEHNQQMREQYLPQPTSTEWSAAPGVNTGDAIRAAMALGAATRAMNGGWWCSSMRVPGEPVPRLAIMDKSYPGGCVVNARGGRIANESQNYMGYQLEFYRKHTAENPQWPSWLVFDSRARHRYFLGPLWPTRYMSDRKIPRSYYDSGFLTKADTVRELAVKAGIDAAGLERTIAAMNEYARSGKDLEFGRGDAEYDRYYADPTVKPNPCLAPIATAPFYAMRIDHGDFGTHGGLVTNTDGQVTKPGGEPIPGLYATGNCAAPILPTYPGPGATLGPAMTFAWQAAKHLARVSETDRAKGNAKPYAESGWGRPVLGRRPDNWLDTEEAGG